MDKRNLLVAIIFLLNFIKNIQAMGDNSYLNLLPKEVQANIGSRLLISHDWLESLDKIVLQKDIFDLILKTHDLKRDKEVNKLIFSNKSFSGLMTQIIRSLLSTNIKKAYKELLRKQGTKLGSSTQEIMFMLDQYPLDLENQDYINAVINVSIYVLKSYFPDIEMFLNETRLKLASKLIKSISKNDNLIGFEIPIYFPKDELLNTLKSAMLAEDIDKQEQEINNALLLACREGNTYLVRLLMGVEADVDTIGINELKDGSTPLSIACVQGYIDLVKLLLFEYNANINMKDVSGFTPIMYAVIYKYENIVKMLIDNEANINLPDKIGTTPLIRAVQDDSLNIASLLIHANALIHSIDVYGENALSYSGSQEMTKLLIGAGAYYKKLENCIIS